MQATRGSEPLRVPSAATVKRRVMEHTETAINEQKAFFEVCLLTSYIAD
jgi:hypothetical protein